MSATLVAALLAATVLATWLGCVGFSLLRTPFDRLHCVAFVNATAWTALAAAAFVSDGASGRALKILAIVAVNLLAGAATTHATARALLMRAAPAAPQPPKSTA